MQMQTMATSMSVRLWLRLHTEEDYEESKRLAVTSFPSKNTK